MTTVTKPRNSWRDIPAGIWVLGFVSMLMDISSEMIHALLPIYLVTVLGTSMLTVGAIEGIAEATASITKIFSGALSDWLGKRKFLAVIGYGLAAVTKPFFPLAPSVAWLVAARFIDRVGKGIRGAPRDALVADIAPPQLRGASFGLRQSLDTVGAFLGPLLAILLMWLTADHFTTVFWVAVIPAFLALGLIIFAVREPERPAGLRKVRSPLSLTELRRLGSSYWWIVAVAAVFTLARFSEAFLVLRAQSVGLPVTLVPAVMVLMNVVYSATAYPAGILSDRVNRLTILALGLILLIVAVCCPCPRARHCGRCHRRGPCGACTWASRKVFSPRWLPILRRRSCAARPTECSTSSAAGPCWRPAFSPEFSGTYSAPSAPSRQGPRSRRWHYSGCSQSAVSSSRDSPDELPDCLSQAEGIGALLRQRANVTARLFGSVSLRHPRNWRRSLAVLNTTKVTALFVVEAGKPVGIIHVHDLLRAGAA